MKAYLVVIVLFVFGTFMQAQSDIIGIWKTVDDTDGVEKSYVEIFENEGKIYGTVIKLLERAEITHCHKCKGDKKDKALVGMTILSDLEYDDGQWSGGLILDPASGKEYKCKVELENKDKLKLRGYIGNPLFGRSQYWYRVTTKE